MAKHTGITLRFGAAYDRVEAGNVHYERSEMRKAGRPELQGELRRTTVDVWAEQHAQGKAKRGNRRAAKAKHKAARD